MKGCVGIEHALHMEGIGAAVRQGQNHGLGGGGVVRELGENEAGGLGGGVHAVHSGGGDGHTGGVQGQGQLVVGIALVVSAPGQEGVLVDIGLEGLVPLGLHGGGAVPAVGELGGDILHTSGGLLHAQAEGSGRNTDGLGIFCAELTGHADEHFVAASQLGQVACGLAGEGAGGVGCAGLDPGGHITAGSGLGIGHIHIHGIVDVIVSGRIAADAAAIMDDLQGNSVGVAQGQGIGLAVDLQMVEGGAGILEEHIVGEVAKGDHIALAQQPLIQGAAKAGGGHGEGMVDIVVHVAVKAPQAVDPQRAGGALGLKACAHQVLVLQVALTGLGGGYAILENLGGVDHQVQNRHLALIDGRVGVLGLQAARLILFGLEIELFQAVVCQIEVGHGELAQCHCLMIGIFHELVVVGQGQIGCHRSLRGRFRRHCCQRRCGEHRYEHHKGHQQGQQAFTMFHCKISFLFRSSPLPYAGG